MFVNFFIHTGINVTVIDVSTDYVKVAFLPNQTFVVCTFS